MNWTKAPEVHDDVNAFQSDIDINYNAKYYDIQNDVMMTLPNPEKQLRSNAVGGQENVEFYSDEEGEDNKNHPGSFVHRLAGTNKIDFRNSVQVPKMNFDLTDRDSKIYYTNEKTERSSEYASENPRQSQETKEKLIYNHNSHKPDTKFQPTALGKFMGEKTSTYKRSSIGNEGGTHKKTMHKFGSQTFNQSTTNKSRG